MQNRVLVVTALITLLSASLWCADVISDRAYKIQIQEPVSLYALAPADYPASNPVIASLLPSDKVKVLRMSYGKDFQAFKVETQTGQIGWLFTGASIRVSK